MLATYDRQDDRVSFVDVREPNASMQPIAAIFEALSPGGPSESTGSVSFVSPLPTVPLPAGTAATGPTSLSTYGNVSLEYEGTGTVDGREAYVIEMTPAEPASVLAERTLWLDAEWYYPFKPVGRITSAQGNGTVTMTYRNVTVDPDVPPEAFDFDVPADATVENASVGATVDTEIYDEREALVAATDRRVPAPDVPPSFRFDAGNRVVNGSTEQVSVRYTNGTETLVVTVDSSDGLSDPTGERIEIDGHSAWTRAIVGNRAITLDCGESSYTLVGPPSRDTMRAVAASLQC